MCFGVSLPGTGMPPLLPNLCQHLNSVSQTASSTVFLVIVFRCLHLSKRRCEEILFMLDCLHVLTLKCAGHTEYVFQISGADGKVWKVSRRYREFVDLDEKLRQVSSFFQELPRSLQTSQARTRKCTHNRHHPPLRFILSLSVGFLLSLGFLAVNWTQVSREEKCAAATLFDRYLTKVSVLGAHALIWAKNFVVWRNV